MRKLICPFCGHENEADSRFCSVCKADLTTLPEELYPKEQETPIRTAPKSVPTGKDGNGIPGWMKKKLEEPAKPASAISYDNYFDALFNTGGSDPAPAAEPAKKPRKSTSKSPRSKKNPSDVQPTLSIWDEAPLRDGSDPAAKAGDQADTTPEDFSVYRPAMKWDDQAVPPSDTTVEEQVKAEFPAIDYRNIPYPEDAPLFEEDSRTTEEKTAAENDEYRNSASLTKLADAKKLLDENEEPLKGSEDELKLDENSLISDLMRDIDTPQEDRPPQADDLNEVVFNAAAAAETTEQPQQTSSAGETSADVLDRILHEAGYHMEGEAETPPAEPETPTAEPENPEPDEELRTDLNEIPWNLFESGDMFIPMPDDDSYRTFSRAQIPAPTTGSDYQQRMITTLIDGLVRLEKQPRTAGKHFRQPIGKASRIVFALLAIIGCALILLTDLTDRLPILFPAAEKAVPAMLTDAGKEVLISLDYSFAYASELDDCLFRTIDTLLEKGTKVRLQTLNMGALPQLNTVYEKYGIEVENEGFMAGNAAAVQHLLQQHSIPSQVILFASDMTAVRTWAEQLYGRETPITLDVVASSQLSTVLQPYTDSGMIRNAVSTPAERQRFTGAEFRTRPIYALWFMILTAFFAWICGCMAGFLKRDPDLRSLPRSRGESQVKNYIPRSGNKEDNDDK